MKKIVRIKKQRLKDIIQKWNIMKNKRHLESLESMDRNKFALMKVINIV